jgi:hypothetical protein
MSVTQNRSEIILRRIVVVLTSFTPGFALAILLLPLTEASLTAQTKSATEYQVKAAFLYNFAKFVDWPPSAFSDAKQPFDICVYGRDPFGPALDDALSGKSIGDHRVEIGRAKEVPDLMACHMIFVSASQKETPAELVDRLKPRAVLLVGESDGFAVSGGAIQFTVEDSHVHFLINPDAADRAGLKISSKLLALAKIVRDPGRLAPGSALK